MGLYADPACAPFNNAAEGLIPARKVSVDPKHPLGSLTAGGQQFTIIGDTNHADPLIRKSIADQIDDLSKSGVKHIMLEYALKPEAELNKKYPGLEDAKTLDEKHKVLDSYKARLDAYIQEATERETAGIDMFKDKEAWDDAFSRGYYQAAMVVGGEIQAVNNAHGYIDTHDFMNKLYANPPQISNQEAMERAGEFATNHSKTREDAKKSGEYFVETLIKARDRGIQVHFTGDDREDSSWVLISKAQDDLERLDRKNPRMAAYFEQVGKGDFSIPKEDEAEFNKFFNEKIALQKRYTNLLRAENSERVDPDLESRRVDKFIAHANGDKAVIIWGSGHTSKPHDFDEILDQKLRQQALKEGTFDTYESTKSIFLYGSKEDHINSKNAQGTDEPDARFFIKESEVEISKAGHERLCVGAQAPDDKQVTLGIKNDNNLTR